MNCVVCNKELTGRQKRFCSDTCGDRHHNDTGQCYENQVRRAVERKALAVKLLGGKCKTCGLVDEPIAYDLHHTGKKSFTLDSRSLSNRSWSKILEEIKMCELLCAICHRKLHAKHW